MEVEGILGTLALLLNMSGAHSASPRGEETRLEAILRRGTHDLQVVTGPPATTTITIIIIIITILITIMQQIYQHS